jgi:putative ABC transport system permease protein
MESLFREIAHATKLLWKDRGFAATVILTLAVCIGANAAIFTVVNSVLLRPLPVPEAGRILVMSNQYPGAGVPETFSNSIPDYLERRLAMTAFEEQATFRFDDYTIDVDGTPGLLIGMVPLARLSRINLSTALREDSRSGTGRRSRTVRRGLVVAQVGLAFMLLIGAGLLFASFRQLLAVDPGFKPERVVTVSIAAPGTKYPQPVDIRRFFDRTLESIRALPGVVAAGGTTAIPFSGRFDRNAILAEGYQFRPGESLVAPFQVTVTPGYFEAMATPLMRGRYFNERDTDTSPGVVIVDEKLARKFWGDADPIGRRMYEPGDDDLLKITEKTRWWTVVGVVRDVQLADLSGAQQAVGAYYFSATQSQQYTLTLAIKTALDPATLVKEVRSQMAKIDPDIPLFEIRTMEERMRLSLLSRRAAMVLALAFGGVALFLSAIGIYGVLTYLVAQRTREIGIRIALGSSTNGIFGLVLREGTILVLIGVVVGVVGIRALRGAIESQVYGVQPMDPLVLGIVAAGLIGIALAACVLPARRATQVDPVIVLNS